MSITVIESLPKEKTSVLGTAEACLGARFLKYPLKNPEEPDAPVGPPPPLSFKETINVAYLNTKLVAVPAAKPGQGDDASSGQPEIDIEVSISKLLIQPEIVENGNFMTFKVDDLLPVPEEWSLREGNEKDLNTSKRRRFMRECLFSRLPQLKILRHLFLYSKFHDACCGQH